MTTVKPRDLHRQQAPKEGKAVAGVRALRERLAQEVPAFRMAVDLEEQAEGFCRELRNSVREARTAQELDQAAVAERLDMTQSAVSKVESGEGDIGAKTIFRLAHALGLRPVCVFVPRGAQLFSESPSDSPDESVLSMETLQTMTQAAEDLQVNLVRETSNRVSNAMVGFARAFK